MHKFIAVVTACTLLSIVAGGYLALSLWGPTSSIATGQASSIIIPQKTCRNVTYSEQELYLEQECSTEPYVATECSNKSLRFSVTDKQCAHDDILQNWVSKCTVKNLDETEGTFVISVGFNLADGQKSGEIQSKPIYAGDQAIFGYAQKENIAGCYCEVTSAPTKEICNPVQKEKEVCKDAPKIRNVEKTRQECY